MTRWLRTVRTTGLLIALGAGAVAVPCGAGTSYGAEAVRGGEPARDGGKSAFAPTAREGGAVTDRPGWARGGAVGPGVRYVPSASASASAVPGSQAAPGVRGSATASAVPDSSVTPRAVHVPSEPVLHGSRPVRRAEATASPSAEPSRAGSRAGEGRERPGRREAAETGEEDAGAGVGSESEAEPPPADGDATVVAEPSREAVPHTSPPPRQPGRQGVTRAESPTEPVLRILPLGSGLVLIGLGLGLAFVGLRVRRG
ncbi:MULTISPECIES: hypothetical protein [unclassified Streptomyces]|uniref:hypothetical protein n=1 Tax=unclassified Streptomyces TaxID=2593676 RepID=UPI0036EECFA7